MATPIVKVKPLSPADIEYYKVISGIQTEDPVKEAAKMTELEKEHIRTKCNLQPKYETISHRHYVHPSRTYRYAGKEKEVVDVCPPTPEESYDGDNDSDNDSDNDDEENKHQQDIRRITKVLNDGFRVILESLCKEITDNLESVIELHTNETYYNGNFSSISNLKLIIKILKKKITKLMYNI